ncbi:MAG: quinone-dependent dihydroorotate dehydrogenase [Gammaproteobacteria bacterium]|nr:quinone-dependent dihydroorotate dehydrogenase [Gammaproteobacteria bacterium]
MLYSLIRSCLFTLNPDTAHQLTLNTLQWAHRLKLVGLIPKPIQNPLIVMGITFPNPVGLAAGYDRNGEYIDALSALGFGFIEIGTVVPMPQVGNQKPRLFRFPKQQALINRVGFASLGVDYVIQQLKKMQYSGVLGINIGKNKNTPNDQAIQDYLLGFNKLAPYASYITINISSPNTQGLRDLQAREPLQALVQALKKAQHHFFQTHQKYVPLVIKIAPDLNDTEISTIADIILKQQVDGLIATNTTLTRPGLTAVKNAQETGGLSGKPLEELSTEVIQKFHHLLQHHVPIIASGGVIDQVAAEKKLAAGATLVQLYTGLIYQGPSLIRRIASSLKFTQGT